jgi:hypothetical protein
MTDHHEGNSCLRSAAKNGRYACGAILKGSERWKSGKDSPGIWWTERYKY